MDIEKAISGETPGSSLGKYKRKKLFSPASISEKDEASVPTNVDITEMGTPTVVTSEKKKRAKKVIKRSDTDSVEISTTNDHKSSLVVPENVAPERKKKKRRKEKIKATNLDSEAGKSPEEKGKTEISCDVEMPNATSLETEADVAPEKKKKTKKKKKSSDDLEMVEATVETTIIDSGADIAPLEKKKKRKTNKSDDLEMKTVDPSEVKAALDAMNLDFGAEIAPLEKKKKRKTKKSVDLETKTVGHENTSVPSKVETALDSRNLDSGTEIAPLEKKKKKRTKISNDVEVPNSDNSADVALGEKKMKIKTEKSEILEIKTVNNRGKGLLAILKEKSHMERLKKFKNKNKIENTQCSVGESIREDVGLNSTAIKEDSSLIEDQRDLQIEVRTSSTSKKDDGSELVSEKSVELSDDKGITITSSDVKLKGESNSEGINKETNLVGSLPKRSLVSGSRKKLLILDVNGILVDFVNFDPAPYKADITISRKYVFKRPYCDEFLRFCFERFEVGVWSSRIRWNMEQAVNFLFREFKNKLLFCWDQSHCTMTGFNTIDNQNKPLVMKELKNVWQKLKPGLPFGRGAYDETNTLLLDDSPYKALRNPPNTAIFPNPYIYTDENDNALGPEGDLRAYLERLSKSGDISVQTYVEQNPFGQPAITESHESWDFYSKIVNAKQTNYRM